MSVIILAQSLKNDGTADIQIDENFSLLLEKLDVMNDFYRRGGSVKYKKCNCGIEFGIYQNPILNSVYCINVIGEGKDVIGRDSPICIQANLMDLQKIVPCLKNFLQKSGRSVSEKKMKCLDSKIESHRNNWKSLIKILIYKFV